GTCVRVRRTAVPLGATAVRAVVDAPDASLAVRARQARDRRPVPGTERRMMTQTIFWGAVALAAYAWAGYPVLLMALGPITDRRVAKRPVTPPVTFIITAYNEEQRLRAKIENTLAQDYPVSRFEVIVAS